MVYVTQFISQFEMNKTECESISASWGKSDIPSLGRADRGEPATSNKLI